MPSILKKESKCISESIYVQNVQEKWMTLIKEQTAHFMKPDLNLHWPHRLFKFRSVLKELIPLPNDKILDLTKLKVFADDKLNFGKITISLLDRVENTVVKGENAG